MAAPSAQAATYVPAVFVPPKTDNPEDELVDSLKGLEWHLAPQDPEVRKGIYAGEVTPVSRKDFDASKKAKK